MLRLCHVCTGNMKLGLLICNTGSTVSMVDCKCNGNGAYARPGQHLACREAVRGIAHIALAGHVEDPQPTQAGPPSRAHNHVTDTGGGAARSILPMASHRSGRPTKKTILPSGSKQATPLRMGIRMARGSGHSTKYYHAGHTGHASTQIGVCSCAGNGALERLRG